MPPSPHHGGPLFDQHGRLIAYVVAYGQGPTQIAKDLNDHYGCMLVCEVQYEDIVLANKKAFLNVLDENGYPLGKYSDLYRSGNIEPGDILFILQGKQSQQDIQLIWVKAIDLQRHILRIDSIVDKKGNFLMGHGFHTEMTKWDRMDPHDGGTGANMGSAMEISRLHNDTIRLCRDQRLLIALQRDLLMRIEDKDLQHCMQEEMNQAQRHNTSIRDRKRAW